MLNLLILLPLGERDREREKEHIAVYKIQAILSSPATLGFCACLEACYSIHFTKLNITLPIL